MYDNFGELEASVQQKIDADADFQTSLADLSDEDKQTAMMTKKSELLDDELKTFSETSKKNKELADNYKTRAEKAEMEAKKAKPADSELSQKDLLTLAKADVHEEDVDTVLDWAKFKKIDVKTALQSPEIKSILQTNTELRKSAEVANAKPARVGQQKPTDEAVLADAMSNDKIPVKGSDEADRLFWARHGGKR